MQAIIAADASSVALGSAEGVDWWNSVKKRDREEVSKIDESRNTASGQYIRTVERSVSLTVTNRIVAYLLSGVHLSQLSNRNQHAEKKCETDLSAHRKMELLKNRIVEGDQRSSVVLGSSGMSTRTLA